MKRQFTYVFPDKFRQDDSYEGWDGAYVSAPAGGFATSRNLAWPLDKPVHAVLRRQFLRDPIVALKLRSEKGFSAIGDGKDEVGDTEVELLTVGLDGAKTTLAVDLKSGQVLQARYRDRAPSAIGAVFKTYSDFRAKAGLTIPFGQLMVHDGRRVTIPAVTLESVEVNGKVDAKLFEKPE
jgi:hypothetical protein